MANLQRLVPPRPTVVSPPTISGGEFGLRGMGDKLTGDAYVPVGAPEDAETMYVSPKTPLQAVFAEAPEGRQKPNTAVHKRMLKSVDEYLSNIQGRTPRAKPGPSTPESPDAELPDAGDEDAMGGRTPPIHGQDDMGSWGPWRRGESSKNGSTAQRANRNARFVSDRKLKTIAGGR